MQKCDQICCDAGGRKKVKCRGENRAVDFSKWITRMTDQSHNVFFINAKRLDSGLNNTNPRSCIWPDGATAK
jgi:hypothetical protein